MPMITAHAPGTSVRPMAPARAPWLIGLPFRSAADVVRRYYVVHEAKDRPHAVRVALERASGEQDRPAHQEPLVRTELIEVQQISRDALGRPNLVPWP